MNRHDPHSYYACLGLAPGATPAQIKAAFRSLAQKWHPDRNPGVAEATLRFQEISGAYSILSDTKAREAYDASTIDPEADRAAKGQSTGPVRYEPIVCSRCGNTSALPRYRVFHAVFGWVFGTTRWFYQGIYCGKCETVVAMKATSITLVVGWLSLQGIVYSLAAICKNLVGGPKFLDQDTKLLAYQAMYFASIGKMDLALAVARQAIRTADQADRARWGSSAEAVAARNRVKMGYEDHDPLKNSRETMVQFLAMSDGTKPALELKGTSNIWNSRFSAQLALIMPIVIGFSIWLYVDYLKVNEADQRAEAREISLLAQNRAAELERWKKQHAVPQEAPKEATNEAPQELPPSGILSLYQTPPPSQNMPPFKVKAGQGTNFMLKLVDPDSGRPVLSVFVRATEQIEVRVPPGSYVIKVAAGRDWYGEGGRFGPTTAYTIIDTPAVFSIEGDQLLGNEIRLVNVSNGNLTRRPITADQF